MTLFRALVPPTGAEGRTGRHNPGVEEALAAGAAHAINAGGAFLSREMQMRKPRQHRSGNAPYYSAREIAGLLGVAPAIVVARADAEGWRTLGILTGECRRYATLALPRDVRMAIATGSERRARARQSKSVLIQWVAR